MGQALSLILSHIADDPLIPWDLPHAATVLQSYLTELNATIADSTLSTLELSPLEDAIAEFETRAKHIGVLADHAISFNDTVLLGVINSKFRDFSRGFASAGGLPGRETFKNVVSAPGIDNGYGADVFPGVTDSVNAGNEETAGEWIEKTAAAVKRAAKILTVGE